MRDVSMNSSNIDLPKCRKCLAHEVHSRCEVPVLLQHGQRHVGLSIVPDTLQLSQPREREGQQQGQRGVQPQEMEHVPNRSTN